MRHHAEKPVQCMHVEHTHVTERVRARQARICAGICSCAGMCSSSSENHSHHRGAGMCGGKMQRCAE
eukprot:6185994-Pleurochrysis_carterae.AAC.3